MTGLIPAEELKRLQKRMSRLMDDLGLTDLESRYTDELQKMQARLGELMEEAEGVPEEADIVKPLADVRETDEEVIVTMDLPGVEKKDVDITITDDELRVVAERKTETELSLQDYHKRERICRKFERRVSLPAAVKMDEAKARLDGGVLEIKLPKEVVTAKKRISID